MVVYSETYIYNHCNSGGFGEFLVVLMQVNVKYFTKFLGVHLGIADSTTSNTR